MRVVGEVGEHIAFVARHYKVCVGQVKGSDIPAIAKHIVHIYDISGVESG